MRDYEIVSTDSHLEVSPDSWRPFVDREFQDYAPKVVKLPNGGDAWLMPGKANPVPLGLNFSAGRGWENLKTSGLSYADGLVGAGDGKQRLREMDQDGVDAEILFPAVSGQRTLDIGAMPAEAYVAIARGYNDWLSQEFTAEDRDRLLGLAILPCRERSTTRSPSCERVVHDAGHPRRRAARRGRTARARPDARRGRPLLDAGDRARRADSPRT